MKKKITVNGLTKETFKALYKARECMGDWVRINGVPVSPHHTQEIIELARRILQGAESLAIEERRQSRDPFKYIF